jgi:predicted RNase H-like nuclease (RuvC/YqgF family)
MWQQIVHIASGGTGIGVSLDNVDGEQELDKPTANSIEDENLQYIIDDLRAENKELRKSRNSLYVEIENLKSRLDNKEGLPLFEEFQKLIVELTDAKRLISFLETHNREQAESAGLLQIQLVKRYISKFSIVFS